MKKLDTEAKAGRFRKRILTRFTAFALALTMCAVPVLPIYAAEETQPAAQEQTQPTTVQQTTVPVKSEAEQAREAALKKANKYKSRTKYLILVPRKQHKVLIYKGKKGKWKLHKEYRCTVGKKSTPTPKGTYTVKAKGKYFNTTDGRGRCWYYTQFRGNYLFHSVIYKRASKPRKIRDGRLGRSLSHGCIRLELKNAKWIYKHVPRGTKVVIY